MKKPKEKFRLNVKLLSTLNNVLYMKAVDIMKIVGIPKTTWYDIMHKPDTITVQHLISISNGLHIPVRRLFSTGSADIIGKREDLIADPYEECRYDGDALRETINARRDTTWKCAGEVSGMTYQHVQKSLASERRTPVVRFLAVCEDFGIDPFTVLIDPNPEPVPEPEPKPKRKGGRRAEPAVIDEIASLREDIGRLNGTIADITEEYKNLLAKYDRLLDAHRLLLDRLDGHMNGGVTSLAADPFTTPDADK